MTEKLRTETDDRFARLEERVVALEDHAAKGSVVTPAQAEEHLQSLRKHWGQTDEEVLALATAGKAHHVDYHLWLILLGRGDLVGQQVPVVVDEMSEHLKAVVHWCGLPDAMRMPHASPDAAYDALKALPALLADIGAQKRILGRAQRQLTEERERVTLLNARWLGAVESGTSPGALDGLERAMQRMARELHAAVCESGEAGLACEWREAHGHPDDTCKPAVCGRSIPIPVKPSTEAPELTCDVKDPELRTTATAEEAIRWSEAREGHSVTALYEPGNGSRYLIRVDRVLCSPRVADELGISGYCYVLVTDLLQGTSIVVQAAPDAARVATGLQRSPADGEVLAELIAHLLSGLDKPKGSSR